MKTLLLCLALVAPLWVFAQVESPPPRDQSPPAKPPFVPLHADSTAAARYQIIPLGGNSDTALALRVDTFTGQTWSLQRTPGQQKNAAGTSIAMDLDHWKECLEADAMVALHRHDDAPPQGN